MPCMVQPKKLNKKQNVQECDETMFNRIKGNICIALTCGLQKLIR